VTQTPPPDQPETPDQPGPDPFLRVRATEWPLVLGAIQGIARAAPSRPLTFYTGPGGPFTSGDEVDLTEETPQPLGVTREPMPPAERTRRGLLIGLGAAFLAILIAQVVLGLAVGADDWARVGPVLSTAATLVAGGLGFAFGHYFSGRD